MKSYICVDDFFSKERPEMAMSLEETRRLPSMDDKVNEGWDVCYDYLYKLMHKEAISKAEICREFAGELYKEIEDQSYWYTDDVRNKTRVVVELEDVTKIINKMLKAEREDK